MASWGREYVVPWLDFMKKYAGKLSQIVTPPYFKVRWNQSRKTLDIDSCEQYRAQTLGDSFFAIEHHVFTLPLSCHHTLCREVVISMTNGIWLWQIWRTQYNFIVLSFTYTSALHSCGPWMSKGQVWLPTSSNLCALNTITQLSAWAPCMRFQ